MKSLLTVERMPSKADWMMGRLLVDGVYDGYTCEDEERAVKVHGETAIPYGIYPLGVRQSPKFSGQYLWSDTLGKLILPKDKPVFPEADDWRPHDMIWVQDVPNFQYVLIHWGNSDDDTEGCLLVGKGLGFYNGQEIVTNSRLYYRGLYPRIYPIIKQGNQTIEYKRM